MTAQLDLFGQPVASVRGSDPRTAKAAAAESREDRERQWRLLVLAMWSQGPISADTAARVIGKHRSVASTRLNVCVRRGLAEKEGEHPERDEDGRERHVLRYRLTDEGRRVAAQIAPLMGQVA